MLGQGVPDGTWGNVRREMRGDVGEGLRMPERRHRRGQRSRYRRNGTRRRKYCWEELFEGHTLYWGVPCMWGTHTGAGIPLKGLQPMEDPGWSRKRVRNQDCPQETIAYCPSLPYCPLRQPRDWQGLNIMCGQNRGRGDSER